MGGNNLDLISDNLQYLPEGLRKTMKNLSGQVASRLRFEPGKSRIQVQIVTARSTYSAAMDSKKKAGCKEFCLLGYNAV
jgi:hypothetical protein